ncbi:MAG: hypothetical protein H0T54_06790, partial [Geodermatophilaceae bacterium]|nr:hypothetical protein [Geodermatophilaceae bacterium]
HGVKSVLGFGGALPSGELFAVILFARTHIAASVAQLFRPTAAEVLRSVAGSSARVFDA